VNDFPTWLANDARVRLETLIRDLAAHADPRDDVTPLWSLSAALRIERVAHGRARGFAADARAAGCGWLQIADAAGIDPKAEPYERATAAFNLAAGPARRLWNQTVPWCCPTCRQTITDRGPEAGVDDDETGHADTCARRLAQLAAWQAAWDADDEGERERSW
jgi:hypothetical protein